MPSPEATSLIVALVSFGATVVLFILNSINARDLKNLEGRQSADLAALSAKFQREGFAHDTRFDRLHKRVEVAVLELQPHLGEAVGAYESATRMLRFEGEERPEAQWKRSSDALMKAQATLARTSVFFPIWLLRELNAALGGMGETLRELAPAFDVVNPVELASHTAFRVEARQRAFAVFSAKVIPPLRLFYETTRRVFGVDEVFRPEPAKARLEAKP